MRVVSRFALRDFEKNSSRAHPNLNRIASLMISKQAFSPERALTVTDIANGTGIARSQVDSLIKHRVGFVNVKSLHSPATRYFYVKEFAKDAQLGGDSYPRNALSLVRHDVKEVLISELEESAAPAILHSKYPHDFPDRSRIAYRIVDKTTVLSGTQGILEAEEQFKNAIQERDAEVFLNAAILFLSIGMTIQEHADDIEFWA